jgi:aspartate aminotransferase
MKQLLSKRVQRIKPSPTIVISSKAAAMKQAGRDVISLGLGEPDFDTPEPIKQACVQALKDNHTHYPAVDGIAPLKEAIIRKFKQDNALEYDRQQILVSTGAKQSLYNITQAILNQGDEVIIPAPSWVSYPAMVELADATPVWVNTSAENSYKLTPDALENTITDHTKLLMFNSPSNPSGMIYKAAELRALADVLVKHPNILIISDDIYEKIIWDGNTFCHLLEVAPELYERTIIVNGVSKAYAMTGWRIGYAAGNTDIIAAAKKIQSQSTSGANAMAQYAAVEALTGDQSCVEDMRKEFQQRYEYFIAAINTINGFTCVAPQGAFYLFPDITGAMAIKGCATDIDFADALLENAEVAVVPGSAFGTENHVRLSFATDLDSLKQAIARIKRFMSED